MPMSLVEVRVQAMRLPLEQQLQLAYDILEKQANSIDQNWLKELELRATEIDDGRVTLIDAEDVFASVRANLKASR